MWPFIKPINLIRYLIVWRINSSLVRLPRYPATELSLGLGTLIANRLPTRQARPWRKALAPWDECGGISLIGTKKPVTVPEVSWPIEAVLFVYPAKVICGHGELILWELKLVGESADHGLFLEIILPAMEEAGKITDSQWQRKHEIWGRFDIHAVYVARGPQWEPMVSDGRLDLNYRATPVQWAEGLTFAPRSERIFDRLIWLTPFDLVSDADASRQRRKKKSPSHQTPTLQGVLKALITRMSQLLPGKHHKPDDVWDALNAEEQSSLRAVMEQASLVTVRHASLKPAPKRWPGRWIGTQTFASIPHPVIPYLELASILHIGKQTHFGCGTFMIS